MSLWYHWDVLKTKREAVSCFGPRSDNIRGRRNHECNTVIGEKDVLCVRGVTEMF